MEAKYSFKNDYSELAHKNILQALNKVSTEQLEGYGRDIYSIKAENKIKEILNNENVDVHFISGGTQANLTVISSILKIYESVIAVESGHICVHEAGAVEANGKKINIVKGKDGKIYPRDIKEVLDFHVFGEHMVKPRLVYISNSTELGTIYTKKELTDLSEFCKEHGLLLYLDGARLGVALTSKYNNLSMEEICRLVDVFYIGGTKNGAMLGEAIVIVNDNIKENFRYVMKQNGALLAKGLVGIQFCELFENNLYFELAKHANTIAYKMAENLEMLGYNFLCNYETNQIFPILPNKLIEKLQERYDFYVWQKIDENNSAIRLITSWATDEQVIENFINTIKF